MADGVVVCGYSLGRFVPSRQAFVGRRQIASDESGSSHGVGDEIGVYISMIPPQRVAGSRQNSFPTAEHEDANSACGHGVGTRDAIDVGRALNGSLVRVERLTEPNAREILTQESRPTELYPPDMIPSLFLVSESRGSRSLIEPATEVPRATAQESATHLAQDTLGWRALGRENWQRLLRVTRVHASRFGTSRGSPHMARARKTRLLLVFGGVGVVVLTGMLLSLGNGTEEMDAGAVGVPTPARSPTSLSMTDPPAMTAAPAEANALVEADAVAYAIEEVTSGRAGVAGMDNDGTGVIGSVIDGLVSGVVTGRVVSRNGDIVLVEVSMTMAETKTFATLLLQKTEGGWRTRDVFDEGR